MGSCQFKAGSARALEESRRMIEKERELAMKRPAQSAEKSGSVVWVRWSGSTEPVGHPSGTYSPDGLYLAVVCQYHELGGVNEKEPTVDLVWEGAVDEHAPRDPDDPLPRLPGELSQDVPWKWVKPVLQGVYPAYPWCAGEAAEVCVDAASNTWQAGMIHRLDPGHMRCTVDVDGQLHREVPLCHLRRQQSKAQLGQAAKMSWAAFSATQLEKAVATANPIMTRLTSDRLSGGIDCKIYRARKLPMTDYKCGCFGEKVAGDPYCEIKDDRDRTLVKTKVVSPPTTTPEWNHDCRYSRDAGWLSVPDTQVLRFMVMDADVDKDDVIGQAVLCGANGLNVVTRGGTFCGWLPLKKEARKGPRGELLVWLQLRRDRLQQPSVHAYSSGRFPVHEGCRVTLFQSAHVGQFYNDTLAPIKVYDGEVPTAGRKLFHPSRGLPQFEADDNDQRLPREYQRRNAWEEQFVAMMEAREFIYVVGWSVNPDITMLREGYRDRIPPELLFKEHITIGELLKYKAEQGVKVCVMIWNELTSVEGLISFQGLAGTGSAQTQRYFKGTKVKCKAFYREGVQNRFKLVVSHHQKGVICDAPCLEGQPGQMDGKRRAIGFIGGLDLTGGRWDNPEKAIFRTLGNLHGAPVGGPQGDFYSAILQDVRKHSEISGRRQDPPVPAGTPEGPRQPWQDIHSKVEGAAVRDMIENFENRWVTQGGAGAAADLANITDSQNPRLLRTEEEDVFPPNPDGSGRVRRHPESWSVQYLRSMNQFSDRTVVGIESDIQQAWVQGIENSKGFVYIENQYFMGASHGGAAHGFHWHRNSGSNTDDTATNRVPAAIFNRILKSINKGNDDDWTCYVVMPLFPEGDPESSALQEIMRWQYRTIEMMYNIIFQAIEQKRKSDPKFHKVPQNYLNFFCLGNREPGEHGASKVSSGDTSQRGNMLRNARGQIYVHSKLLIADDEYLIVGSANINDRSMAGDRDTEHAVACWQPAYSWEDGSAPRRPNGAIAAFRKSLWTEHLNLRMEKGQLADWVDMPETPTAVNEVRRMAQDAWSKHAHENKVDPHSVKPQPCHLMSYPVHIQNLGAKWEIIPRPSTLPDHPGAKVKGAPSMLVPDFITS
eukprot:TRINITY_DN277_c0_g1_i1.p1 TRINITY_DN277_c0_g1~~TRINITY_DN277_c0_g1_i1.p1  ORF type:complete len:1135 (+),score=327.96 TRINITY_DN277_c0_g1_i1:83-3406(+)